MQTSRSPDERHPALDWTVEQIDDHISVLRFENKQNWTDWESVRTNCSAVVGLKVVRNLKLGKAPFDGFRKR